MNKQSRVVYGVLVAVWAMMIIWQVIEHSRVKEAAKTQLRNRAKDISNTVGIVLGSQRHMHAIPKERLESALNSLIKPEELKAVAMLNAAGEVVASAGSPIDAEVKDLAQPGEHWGKRTFALMNLVALGTNVTAEPDPNQPTIIAPRELLRPPPRFATNRPSFRPQGPPPGPPHIESGSRPNEASERNAVSSADLPKTNAASGEHFGPGPRVERDGRPFFRRPPWMTPEEYDSLLEKKGLHSFLVVMSTSGMQAASRYDLWLRLMITTLASISVVGLALAWSNLVKSGELEVRLVRAAELNTRLREMSLAAAGLAHETKNPLNLIRGLAQMISKRGDISPELQQKTQGIIEQADRVTGQVNEFINFSRPRQLKPVPVSLNSAVTEVVRALEPDLEEKSIRLQVQNDLPAIEADEQQLRQALFNLLMNAIQAVGSGGEIQVSGSRRSPGQGVLEIRDNGPGVPPEHRTDVFKPYFTTSERGTGLGLAVVQQIVLAHGWEIECLPNAPRGANFRISHLRLATSLGSG